MTIYFYNTVLTTRRTQIIIGIPPVFTCSTNPYDFQPHILKLVLGFPCSPNNNPASTESDMKIFYDGVSEIHPKNILPTLEIA